MISHVKYCTAKLFFSEATERQIYYYGACNHMKISPFSMIEEKNACSKSKQTFICRFGIAPDINKKQKTQKIHFEKKR